MRAARPGVAGARSVRITLEYDGSGFAGFQVQPDARTVQGVLEEALARVCGQAIRVTGAGRTDAGVHARGQVCSFRLPAGLPVERVPCALNGALPPDVRVLDAAEVDAAFHARYSATSRHYEYLIAPGRERDVFSQRYVWMMDEPLDAAAMSEAAGMLVGTHDFRAFGTPEKGRSPVRELSRCEVSWEGDLLRIRYAANAFLQHMARGLTGALVDVGRGRMDGEQLSGLLRGGAGQQAPVAPPNGLYLVLVEY